MFRYRASQPIAIGRPPVISKRGMVATSQHLAAQAGLRILQQGGNAIDAAIATAATLTVTEPTSNGIGGDAFALVWTHGKLHGLNASGPAPRGISLKAVADKGFSEMPTRGWIPVTVPGVPAAWATLSQRFGKLPLKTVMESAIFYAENGYAVSPTVAKQWARAYDRYTPLENDPQFKPWFSLFAPKGRAPLAGEHWCSADHASTLRKIADSQARDFYEGELAGRIDASSREHGGYLRKEDLAAYQVQWIDPISTSYRGYQVWELPPNGQGIATLEALAILEGMHSESHESEKRVHHAIEAVKLAMSDAAAYVTDPSYMPILPEQLLSEKHISQQRGRIGERALMPTCNEVQRGGTVYLATADDQGNMVSYIQSNYEGFGSGIVIPNTGIAMQNRGANFSLDPKHPNCLEGQKRSYHTIIPGFLTKDEQAIGPFGVMGGFNQPQGHLQTLLHSIDREMDPQSTLDAPRWRWLSGRSIVVEEHFPQSIVQALRERGHEVEFSANRELFGRGQIIWGDESEGFFVGGTDSRSDGTVAAW